MELRFSKELLNMQGHTFNTHKFYNVQYSGTEKGSTNLIKFNTGIIDATISCDVHTFNFVNACTLLSFWI